MGLYMMYYTQSAQDLYVVKNGEKILDSTVKEYISEINPEAAE